MANVHRSLTERQYQAYQLWLSGLSFRALGRQLVPAISEASAHELVQKAIAKRAGLVAADQRAEKLRDLDRIDTLMQAVLPKALSGSLAAVQRMEGLIALRARIGGYDVVKHEHSGRIEHLSLDVLDAEIEQLSRAVAAGADGAPVEAADATGSPGDR